MRTPRYKRGAKTMKDVKVIDVTFVRDDSGSSAERTTEIRKLIAQMIEFSHKRGRPAKAEEGDSDAA